MLITWWQVYHRAQSVFFRPFPRTWNLSNLLHYRISPIVVGCRSDLSRSLPPAIVAWEAFPARYAYGLRYCSGRFSLSAIPAFINANANTGFLTAPLPIVEVIQDNSPFQKRSCSVNCSNWNSFRFKCGKLVSQRGCSGSKFLFLLPSFINASMTTGFLTLYYLWVW
jgi:hypothetical protein